MNEKKENAINGFETIPTTTPGMNLDAPKGTIPRVELENSLEKRLRMTDGYLKKNEKQQQTETNKTATVVKGFGGMTFYTLGIIFSAEKTGRKILMRDTEGNELTEATEICRRNRHLVEQYYKHDEDNKIGYNHDDVCYEDTDYEGGQEYGNLEDISSYDVKNKPDKVKIAKLLKEAERPSHIKGPKGLEA
jgi:hypothetical protein